MFIRGCALGAIGAGLILLAVACDRGAERPLSVTSASTAPLRDPPSSELYFRRFLQEHGVDVVRMTPAQGVGAMFDFYDAAKFNVVSGGDMLRVSWNSDDARSTLIVFRELTWTAGNPDSRVERWALWLKYEFDRIDRSVPTGAGSRRCTGPHAREECDAFVRALQLYRALADRNDGDVQVGFDAVPLD